jgi:hypothetical protein
MSQNIVAVCDVDQYARSDSTRTDGAQPVTGATARRAVETSASDAVKAQMDADAKRAAQDTNANLKRFVEQLPGQRHTDYRQMLDKQRTSTASSSRRRITCTRRLRWRRWMR